jgi:hypothetical protein
MGDLSVGCGGCRTGAQASSIGDSVVKGPHRNLHTVELIFQHRAFDEPSRNGPNPFRLGDGMLLSGGQDGPRGPRHTPSMNTSGFMASRGAEMTATEFCARTVNGRPHVSSRSASCDNGFLNIFILIIRDRAAGCVVGRMAPQHHVPCTTSMRRM